MSQPLERVEGLELPPQGASAGFSYTLTVDLRIEKAFRLGARFDF